VIRALNLLSEREGQVVWKERRINEEREEEEVVEERCSNREAMHRTVACMMKGREGIK
jgi:hypothetical protein